MSVLVQRQQLIFFQQVSDWIQWALIKQSPESTTVDDLDVGVENVFKNEWLDSIDEELKQGITTWYHILMTCYP